VISGYGHEGINVTNAISTATIMHNRISGIGGSPDHFVSGITVQLGATATIVGNTEPSNFCALRRPLGTQPRLASTDDRMGAVGNLELAKDAGDVIADCFWTEHQPTCDLGVTQAASDQPQNFALAIGQLRERYGRPRHGVAKKAVRRRATVGPKSASPLATARMALSSSA
jgi:hypothetical protein